MARPYSAPREGVWDMAIEQLSSRTVECVPVTVQYSVTWYLKYVINGKFKISAWLESELETWKVNRARIVLSHELEHHWNWNHRCRKVASLTLVIAIADIMTGFTWLIKFLGNKLLYGHVPDPFPLCGTWSDHVGLHWVWALPCSQALVWKKGGDISQKSPCRIANKEIQEHIVT